MWWPCGYVLRWIKNLPADTGDPSFIPGSGRSPGGGSGNPLQYSCLENPVDRGAWWAAVHGVAKCQTRLNDWAHNTHPQVLVHGLGPGCWHPVGRHGGRMWGPQCSSPGLWSTCGHKDTTGDLLWCDGVGAPAGPWGQGAEGWSGRSPWRKHYLNPQESFLPHPPSVPGFSLPPGVSPSTLLLLDAKTENQTPSTPHDWENMLLVLSVCFLTGGILLYSVVLVSATQLHKSGTIVHMSLPLEPPFPPSPASGHHRAQAGSLRFIATSHAYPFYPWWCIYKYADAALSIPPILSPTGSTSLPFASVSPFLPCKQVHQYYFSRIHRYVFIYNVCFSLSDLLFTLYNRL